MSGFFMPKDNATQLRDIVLKVHFPRLENPAVTYGLLVSQKSNFTYETIGIIIAMYF